MTTLSAIGKIEVVLGLAERCEHVPMGRRPSRKPLVGTSMAQAVEDRLRGHELHAPAHFDAQVLSALGRLHGARHLS